MQFSGHVDIVGNIHINNNSLQGDINGDQITNILDVILAINIILNDFIPNESEIWAADVNHDDTINIQDIIILIAIILGEIIYRKRIFIFFDTAFFFTNYFI